MPDGPDKTLWGAEQIAWLKSTLLESDATFKLLISPTPLVGPDDAYKIDNHTNHKGFRHEGREFFKWVVRAQSSSAGFLHALRRPPLAVPLEGPAGHRRVLLRRAGGRELETRPQARAIPSPRTRTRKSTSSIRSRNAREDSCESPSAPVANRPPAVPASRSSTSMAKCCTRSKKCDRVESREMAYSCPGRPAVGGFGEVGRPAPSAKLRRARSVLLARVV